MLDKNPEQIPDDTLEHIWGEFEKNVPSMLLCSDAFEKMEFLNRLICSAGTPVVFVDTDLLYSGYTESAMIQRGQNVEIFRPDGASWRRDLAEIVSATSSRKAMVVIDSFNGVYNMLDSESAVFVNSCVMLLSSIVRQATSSVVITVMARKKEDEWVVSPSGRQIMRSAGTRLYILQKTKNCLLIRTEDSKEFRIQSQVRSKSETAL